MYSIAFRSCRLSSLENRLNKSNAFHCLNAVVSRRQVSSIDTKTDDSEWRNIYKGMLAPRIRNLKVVSFMTSGVGLFVQPMVIQKAAEVGSSLAATIGVCTIAGFFTFITPVLIHLITRKYVTSVEYNENHDEYSATVFSFFLKPKKINFKTSDVRLPMTQKMTVTFYAKEYPLFVDPHAFDDVMHYQRILGYDKPIELDKNNVNVIKKPVVKPANRS